MSGDQGLYSKYDDLRRSPNATFTPLVSDDPSHVGRNLHRVQESEEFLCHVPTMFRWTDGDEDDNDIDISDDAFGGSAAALLAIHHFNTGDGSIVEELQDIQERCPIRLTTELIDSRSSSKHAMQRLTNLLTRSSDAIPFPQPCALLGSSWSSVTKALATVTGVYDLPHVTSSASSVDLDDVSEYPLFARTHPSDASMAQLSMDYLATQLNVDFVGVLHVEDAFGNSYNEQLLIDSAYLNVTLSTESFRSGATDDEIRLALDRLQATGYRYFLGVFFGGDYDRIMTMAYELGIAGPGFFWMFNGALASTFINGQKYLLEDSPLYQATYGNAILSDEGGLPGLDPGHDQFLERWQQIGSNEGLLAYINSKQPESETLSFARTSDYFETVAPSHIAAFSYDAVVGLGLAACTALLLPLSASETIFSGEAHHAVFVDNPFDGASGDVTIGPDSFSRKAESTYHVVSNILPRSTTEDGLASFQGSPWIVYDTATQEWKRYDQDNDFVYPDASTTPPMQIPALEADSNNMLLPVRAVCLALSAVAILLSIGFFVYCCVLKRNHRAIRASQPFFLGMICVGTLLLAASIIPASIDDSVASDRACDIACVAKFWLFPIGFCLIFSALFSKLWRINKLLSGAATFRRIVVHPQDVMVPLVVLMGLNIVVLTMWTIMDTPYWNRVVLQYDPYGRVSESSGSCTSDHMAAYLSPILAINGCALLLALWQAYVGRGITTEFSESKYIAMATACIFQATFMGLPIIFIVEDQPTALLFIYSTIALVICFSILLLIFVPKIATIRSKEPPRSRTTISMGGSRVALGGGTRVSMTGEVIPSTNPMSNETLSSINEESSAVGREERETSEDES